MLKAKLPRFITTPTFPCHYQDAANPTFKLYIFVRHSAQIYLILYLLEGNKKDTKLLSSAISLSVGQRLAGTSAIHALPRHLEHLEP